MAPLAGLTGSLILIGRDSEGADDVLAGWMLRGDLLTCGPDVRNTGAGVWYLPLLLPHDEDVWSRGGYFNGDPVDHILWLEHYHPDGTLGQSLWRNAPAGQSVEWDLGTMGFDPARGGMIRLRVQDLTQGGSPYWMFGMNTRESAQPLVLTAAQAPADTDAATNLVLTGVSEAASGLGEDTLLNLINPGFDPLTCTIRLRNSQGQPAGQSSVALAGNGSTVLVLPKTEANFEGQIEVVSDQPVVGLITRYAANVAGRRLHAASAPLLADEKEIPGEQNYTVILTVRDYFSGAPINGAKFFSHSCGHVTDANGKAECHIDASDTQYGGGFSLQHPDYLQRVLRYQDFEREGSTYHLNLPMLPRDTPLPVATAAWLRPVGSVEEYDVRTEPIDFMRFRSDPADLTLQVEARGFTITAYHIQQGTFSVRSTSGEFKGLKPGEQFAVGKPVFAVIETDFTDLHITIPLQIRIRENPDFPEKMKTLQDSPTFRVPQGIPWLENFNGGISLPVAEVSGVFDGNLFTLVIGVKGAFENGKWLTPKSVMKDMDQAFRDVGAAQRFLRENGGDIKRMPNSDIWAVDAGIMGYLEFAVDDHGKFSLIGGRAMVFGNGSISVTNQFVIVVVPVFISGTVGSSLSVEFAYADGMANAGDFFASATLGFAPFVELEAGVGVKGFLAVSVAGRGTVPIRYRPKDNDFKVQFTLGAEIRAVAFAFVTYSRSIAEKTWEVYPHPGDPGPLWDIDVRPGEIFDMAAYRPEPRSLTGPIWVADQTPPLTLGPVSEHLLVKNILPGAEPHLVRFKGSLGRAEEALLWIDDVPGRDGNDRSALKFMTRWAGRPFDETPKIVSDSGTADIDFETLVLDGDLYVAWQNVKTSLAGEKENLLREMTQRSQIHVARYRSGERFVDLFTVSNSTYGRGRPRLATDGRRLALFAFENDRNNYFANQGANAIYAYLREGSTWGHEQNVFATTQALVTYAAALDRGIPKVIAVIDADGKLETIGDRSLILGYVDNHFIETRIAGPARLGHPRVAQLGGRQVLFWFQDGNIFYNTAPFAFDARNTRRLFDTPPSGLTDDYDLMTDTDAGEVRAVLWVKNDMELNAEACASFYNPQTGDWGEPVPVTRSGMRVEAPQGFVDKDGRAQIAYRRLQYDISSGNYRRGASDLVVADVSPSVDLTMGTNAIVGDAGPQIPGQRYGFEVTVANHGTLTSEGLRLEILDARERVVNTMDFAERLLPGAVKTFKGQYPIPDPLTRHTFKVRVRPLKGEDRGTSPKMASSTVGLADVRIPRVSIWRDPNGKRHTRVHIRNANYVSVPEVRLEIRNASGQTIQQGGPWKLGPNQSEVFEFHETVNEQDDPGYNHRRSYLLNVRGVEAYPVTPVQSVTVNPFHLNALTPSIHQAERIGNTVEVTVTLVNNHPVSRSGDLVVELLDQRGAVAGRETRLVSLGANAASAIAMRFNIPEDPGRHYTARASVPRASLSGLTGAVAPGAASLAPDTDSAEVVRREQGTGQGYQRGW